MVKQVSGLSQSKKRKNLFLFILSLPLFFGLSAGCLPGGGGLVRKHPSPPEVSLPTTPKLKDYAGCLHIHSLYSHDSRGTLEEILRAGRSSGCDFLMTTDHGSLGLKPYEGLHDGLLLVPGMEISTGSGHILALGISEKPTSRAVPELFAEIIGKGGLAFVAHPAGDKANWRGTKEGFLGCEIFNLGTLGKKNLNAQIPSFLAEYRKDRAKAFASILQRPAEELAFFDEISLKRHLVLLGSVDAHAIPIPGGELNLYAHFFPMARLHILAEKLSPAALLSSLRQGKAYFAFDLLEDSTGFLFYGLIGKEKIVMMGSQCVFQKEMHLIAQAPQEGLFVLYKDGKALFQHRGTLLKYTPSQPGVYRVEVMTVRWNKSTPWIYSNPIWLKK